MTLAAAFALEGVPLVLSDLLITFEGGTEQPGVTLPAVDLQTVANRPGVHGLRQKLFVVSNRVAIAYASGDVVRTIVGLRGLRDLAASRDLTCDEVVTFLRDRRSLQASAFVGFHVTPRRDGSIYVQRIQVRGTSFDAGYAGEVHAVGSGLGFLATAVQGINESGFPRLPWGLRQLCKAVSLCGSLTREEHATGSPITAATGGAFEVCGYGPAGFVKAEVTFVAWYVHVDEQEAVDVRYPVLLVKSLYVGDVLVLNCARWSCNPDGSCQRWTIQTHSVPPAYEDAGDPTVIQRAYLGFDSNLTQHSILVMRGEQSALTSIVETGQSGLRFWQTGDEAAAHRLDESLYNNIVSASCEAARAFR